MKTSKKRTAWDLDLWTKRLVYAGLAVLTLSGIFWLIMHTLKTDVPAEMMVMQAVKSWSMRLHAFAASISLITLGAVWATHSRLGWQLQKNRVTGVLNIAVWLLLALTAYCLGYMPDGEFRDWSQRLHWGFGIALPLFVWLHMAKSSSRKNARR